jgi:tetratricopeptide (TPR) repeat protein
VELARFLVPLLAKGGRKKEADELYKTTKALHEGLAKTYPKSAAIQNQLGWLSATCKRDLKQGLASAKRAVELAPEEAAYHDTLAEVLFQLGRNKEAADAQRAAIRLAPRREVYARQLARIEAGDPAAPRAEP